MKNDLKKCFSCGTYSLGQICPKCGQPTRVPHPPKFSYEDKYATYRRKAKYPEAFG